MSHADIRVKGKKENILRARSCARPWWRAAYAELYLRSKRYQHIATERTTELRKCNEEEELVIVTEDDEEIT